MDQWTNVVLPVYCIIHIEIEQFNENCINHFEWLLIYYARGGGTWNLQNRILDDFEHDFDDFED